MTKKQTYLEHFKELKRRVIKLLCIFLVFFLISYFFSNEIYLFLSMPLIDASGGFGKFIYTNLVEGFATKIILSFKTAIFLLIPFISLEAYIFAKPGLYKKEKKFFLSSLISINFLLIVSFSFLYYVVMPKAFEFFISFQQSTNMLEITLEAKISEYVMLISSLMIAFGIAFQLPVIILCLVFFNIISSKTLSDKRRYAILFIFIIAGIITPPDVLSQLLLAFPMMGLYEITIFLAKKLEKGRKNA